MMKSFVFILLGALIGLAVILGVWQVVERNYTYQGSLIDPPATAADFELKDQNGQPFRLSDQKGEVVLMFFGFTNCTDECPITFSEYQRVKQQLGDLADSVRFVFVTVDPERDTTQRIKAYVDGFDPSFIGLTGEAGTLQQVWKDYGVLVEKQAVGSDGGYEIEHNTRIYAIDKQGSWRLTYPFGMESEKLVRDVAHLVKEKTSQ
jgi:protein SCO1/2